MADKQQTSKSSSDLKKRIKELEDKKRREILKQAAKINIVQPAGEDDKVSFDEWWMVASKKISMKPWLKEVVWADFRGRSLSKRESMEKYNQALRQFGYNI